MEYNPHPPIENIDLKSVVYQTTDKVCYARQNEYLLGVNKQYENNKGYKCNNYRDLMQPNQMPNYYDISLRVIQNLSCFYIIR